MKCSCQYEFALNPKNKPYLTDTAFLGAIKKLSQDGRLYFTFNQLFVSIYKLAQAKSRRSGIGCAIVLSIVTAILTFVALGNWFNVKFPEILLGLLIAAPLIIGIWYKALKIKAPYEEVTTAIETFQRLHPIDKLVDGKRFEGAQAAAINEELLNYGPQWILIVERDDMVDMLILNHFHFENKALVLGASKYPQPLFNAYRQWIEKHPDIPIYLIHDASKKGLRLKAGLLKDSEWNLLGKNVRDLGVFPHEIERLKNPLWLPQSKDQKKINDSLTPSEKVDQNMVFPADSLAPKIMLGMAALALIQGVPLLSESILAEQFGRSMSGEASFSDFG
jgi:hypothetical protein